MSSWWIPLLVILGIWRHVVRRVAVGYDPEYWTLVFPLGMYATATFALAGDLPVPFVLPIARLFTYVAIAAWCLTFVGLLRAAGGRWPPPNDLPRPAGPAGEPPDARETLRA